MLINAPVDGFRSHVRYYLPNLARYFPRTSDHEKLLPILWQLVEIGAKSGYVIL